MPIAADRLARPPTRTLARRGAILVLSSSLHVLALAGLLWAADRAAPAGEPAEEIVYAVEFVKGAPEPIESAAAAPATDPTPAAHPAEPSAPPVAVAAIEPPAEPQPEPASSPPEPPAPAEIVPPVAETAPPAVADVPPPPVEPEPVPVVVAAPAPDPIVITARSDPPPPEPIAPPPIPESRPRPPEARPIAPARPIVPARPVAQRPAPTRTANAAAPASAAAEAGATAAKARSTGGGGRDLLTGYKAGVAARIQAQRRTGRFGETGRIVVAFTVDRSGRLGGVAIVTPAASPELDDEALRIVRRASPVDPIPAALADASLAMTVTLKLD
ncbi:energy transducer TonB [Siculibacillus lacustris]|uniref:Energy transducer TonB n=1 Tax=Siculibacillus lacustris TaxID=1549641 RepID=A0A4Q9VPJ8_9HYPH|nr:energy transducer TonB [Siculibacillus lacustris]TBW36757.1 energy transducer TonB [Siculibacillus lacustris]